MFQGKQPIHLIRTPVYASMLDEAGFVQAGHVLKLIDFSGSEAALRHLNKDGLTGLVVTASLDRTNFEEPIRMGDMIRLESRLTQIWRSSMEAEVTVKAENSLNGESRDIAKSYLVFVAVNPDTRQKMSFPPFTPHTLEEKVLARSADIRKQNRVEEGKVAPFIPIEEADNPVVIHQMMTPADANVQGNAFGGVILSIIHEAASEAAKKQALSGTIVGVRQDRMSFIAPTFIGETVEAKAIVTKTWNTSMELQVEVEAINPTSQQRRKVASSYLVYVRLGANGRPAQVPPWIPQTDAQKQRAERADLRREIRKQEEAKAGDISELLLPHFGLKDRLDDLFSRLGEEFSAIRDILAGWFRQNTRR